MVRWIVFFSAFILSICIGFFGYFYLYRAEFISNILTRHLHTKVRIKEIDLCPEGLKFHRLRITNTPDTQIKKALIIDQVLVAMDWSELLKAAIGYVETPIIIKEIILKKPIVALELFNSSGSDNNWERLVNTFSFSSDTEQRTFTLQRLTITKMRIDMIQHTLSSTITHPPVVAKIEINDIGTYDPMPIDQLFCAMSVLLLEEISPALKNTALTQKIKHMPLTVSSHILQTPKHVIHTLFKCVQIITRPVIRLFQSNGDKENGTEK